MDEIWLYSKEDNVLLNFWRKEKKDGDEIIGYLCDNVVILCGYDGDFLLIDDKDIYIFYNVFWVEWIDGVVYWWGVGYVIRIVWESMEKDVEFIFG